MFGGSALVALGLCAVASVLGVSGLPDYAWLLLVLGIDVAHVHATWFRTYLDREELARHPARYVLVPLFAYAAAWLLYRQGALTFWRALAYVAVFHFVRQQVGWVALYRAAEARLCRPSHPRLERGLDELSIYAATLYPLLVWHARASDKPFSWFVSGDFVALPLAPFLPALTWVWATALAAFALRELWRLRRERRVALGRTVLVATTAATWYFGIVTAESDFVFTAANVIPHGVPYLWLLYVYTRERKREAPAFGFGHVAEGGLSAFVALLVGLAFVEEMGWDRLVDHERAWLFGSGTVLSPGVLAWVVPLLVLPQLCHYLLDGLLWRRAESRSRRAQRAAVGFDDVPAPASFERTPVTLPFGLESRGSK